MSEVTCQDFFCSQLSLEANEQLFGTASKTDVWFLLEYTDTWAAKAFNSSKLPESVKERLSYYTDSIPDSRIQLIKQSSHLTSPINFYIGISHEQNPLLYQFQLERYEDLLRLNISDILEGGSKYKSFVVEEPLFLVCTNGNRDKCCAKYGLRVYREMLKLDGSSVWQCTHIGGHRFAANVLCFPHGIYYGRIRDNEISALMEEYTKGRVYLEGYRGRSCYPPHVQAADYFLRTETGVREISAFHLSEIKNVAQDSWIVKFFDTDSGKIHLAHISLEKSAFKNYLSCKDDDKSDVDQYRLQKLESL